MPDIKRTIVLTSEQDDGSHYVLHKSNDNDEIYKYSDKEGDCVYKQTCIKTYRNKVNGVSRSLKKMD